MCAATTNNCDDDLTTDAIPSPPRDENNKKPPGSNNNKTSQDENKTEEEFIDCRPKHNGNYTKKTKSKKNVHHPTSVATVINIKDASGIHIGSNYNVFVNKPDATQKNNKDFIATEAIKRLFSNTNTVTKEHIAFISPHLNEQWRDSARALKYSDGQISQFYEDHIRSGIKEVIYQFLLDWIRNETDEATIGKLSTILWDNNQKDVVNRWSENFLSSNSKK